MLSERSLSRYTNPRAALEEELRRHADLCRELAETISLLNEDRLYGDLEAGLYDGYRAASELLNERWMDLADHEFAHARHADDDS